MRQPTLHLLPRDPTPDELAAVVADVQREASQAAQRSTPTGWEPGQGGVEVAMGPRPAFGRRLFPGSWGPSPIGDAAIATWARTRITLAQHEARASGRRPAWLGPDSDDQPTDHAAIAAEHRIRLLRLLARRWSP